MIVSIQIREEVLCNNGVQSFQFSKKKNSFVMQMIVSVQQEEELLLDTVYEVDKVWRSHHEIAHLQKMTKMKKAEKKLERKSKEGSSCVSGVVGGSYCVCAAGRIAPISNCL